jgi:hypothetical protein
MPGDVRKSRVVHLNPALFIIFKDVQGSVSVDSVAVLNPAHFIH